MIERYPNNVKYCRPCAKEEIRETRRIWEKLKRKPRDRSKRIRNRRNVRTADHRETNKTETLCGEDTT